MFQNLIAPGNSYPVDLPCQDYDVLCPDPEYLSCLESDMKSFPLPSGAEVSANDYAAGEITITYYTINQKM